MFCARCWLLEEKQVNADVIVGGDSLCINCYEREILRFNELEKKNGPK